MAKRVTTGSKKTQSDKELKEVARQVAREALLEAKDLEDDDGEIDEETITLLDSSGDIDDNLSSELDQATGFDLFSDIGEERMKKGDLLRYVIKKYGQHIATKYHPYSWEDCMEEFGPGHYQVIAKSEATKKFVKSETRILGDIRQKSAMAGKYFEEKEEPSPQPVPQNSFLDYFTLIQEQAKSAKEEAREMAKESIGSQQNFMLMFAEMMKSTSNNGSNSAIESTRMIMEMMRTSQESTSRMMEKLAESQAKMFEKINDRIDKMSESKSSEFDTFNKSFEMINKMNELAEKRIQAQLDMIEEAKEEAKEGSGEKKPRSLTDSLIEGVLPLIAQSAASQKQNQHQQQQLLVQRQRQAQHQRRLLHAKNQRAALNRELQHGSGNQKAGPEVIVAEAKKEGESSKEASLFSGGNIGKSVLGLTSIEVEPEVTSEVIDFSSEGVAHQEEATGIKAWCMSYLPAHLGRCMAAGKAPELSAKETIEFLSSAGISREDFLKVVAAQDLISVARAYNLPTEADVWLNEVYAHIQNTAGDDARTEPDASL